MTTAQEWASTNMKAPKGWVHSVSVGAWRGEYLPVHPPPGAFAARQDPATAHLTSRCRAFSSATRKKNVSFEIEPPSSSEGSRFIGSGRNQHQGHMALVIHRRGEPSDLGLPLLLVGGDGRWAKPLLRLLDTLGLSAKWLERWQNGLAALEERQLIIVGSPRIAEQIIELRPTSEPPLVVMTGSLHALSTAVEAQSVPLPMPVTRAELERVLVSVAG